nr:prepilin-type N-terminal cleavage/methylation domain-containing protein [Lachnospiraceae bacterium]
MNNKGFSLIELIIVIAIMAILTSALAPQLMKYIERSKASTDINNAQSIKTNINTCLADESAHQDVITHGMDPASPGYIQFTIDGEAPSDYTLISAGGGFDTELRSTITTWPKTKAASNDKFYCRIYVNKTIGTIEKVEVQTTAFE